MPWMSVSVLGRVDSRMAVCVLLPLWRAVYCKHELTKQMLLTSSISLLRKSLSCC